MNTITTTKQDTITIEVWAIITKEMYEYGYDQPDVSFDEPWQADMADNHCRKFTATLPNNYYLCHDPSNGHQLLWNTDNERHMVFPQIDHDMTTLTLTTFDDDGWNDGHNNIFKCQLTPMETK